MEVEDVDLDQEKLVQKSNNMVAEILKCFDKKSFIVAGDALSRVIAYMISLSVNSGVIKSSEQESILESITKASKFYLNYRNDKEKTH